MRAKRLLFCENKVRIEENAEMRYNCLKQNAEMQENGVKENAETEKAMFRRKIYDKLVQWKQESNGKTALLIEGARRVGKSTIVEAFARNEYESYILIDFAKAAKTVRELFEDVSDLNYLFLQLQLQYKVDLHERNSVIIFDEVQLCPMARQAVKALVQDGRYDYIETGSLISIRKNVKDILIPSEERKLDMFPMDYEEFLWALGDTTTFSLLESCYEAQRGIGEQSCRKLLRDFRLYMLIGGMPQAVKEYLESNNFRKVDAVKRDILSLYEDDFMKIDSILSSDVDEYENCEPSEIGKRYKNDPAMRLTEAIVPVVIESEAVQDTFEWARFINENGIADEILNHPVVRLAEKLFNKHRLLDYHRILFDIPYREKLISE